MPEQGRYYGKYRGTVESNADPEFLGKIRVFVPDVFGPGIAHWAMPCLPYTGVNAGFLALPLPGAGVWVEFEQGDKDYPVWVGGFWGTAAELPLLSNTARQPLPAVTMQTPGKNGVVISDALGPMGMGGVVLQSATGATIAVNDTGIYIDNGKGAQITLVGPSVTVNAGALVVT